MSAAWGVWATARRPRRCRGCNAPIFRHNRYWRVLVVAAFCAPACTLEWTKRHRAAS